MSSSSYAKLGSQCESNNLHSLTSNIKYITPHSEVYYQPYSKMLYYPGRDHLSTYNDQLNNKELPQTKDDSELHRCTSCKS